VCRGAENAGHENAIRRETARYEITRAENARTRYTCIQINKETIANCRVPSEYPGQWPQRESTTGS